MQDDDLRDVRALAQARVPAVARAIDGAGGRGRGMIAVEIEYRDVLYTAEVSRESDGGHNVLVWARCSACYRQRSGDTDLRMCRYSTRLDRIVGWRPSRAWPAAVRGALSRAIARELRRRR